jgi:hypothetical protein
MLPPSVPPPLERFRADCADKDQIRWPVSRCVAPIKAAFKLATVTHRPDKECEMTAADGEPLRTAPATTPARGNACSTPRRSPSALWRHSRRRLRPDCGVQQIDRGPQFAVTSSAIGCRTRRAKTLRQDAGVHRLDDHRRCVARVGVHHEIARQQQPARPFFGQCFTNCRKSSRERPRYCGNRESKTGYA